MSSLNYPPVARMNAARTTEPYHPVQMEKEQKPTIKFRTAACEVACGLHLAAGVFMILVIDRFEQWPLILVMILYCFLAGLYFGTLAAIEKDER